MIFVFSQEAAKKAEGEDTLVISEASETLTKILDNPLFREDVDRNGREIVKRSPENPPQLDEQLVAGMTNDLINLTQSLRVKKRINIFWQLSNLNL